MDLPFSFVFIFILVPGIAVSTAIYGILKRKKSEEKLFRRGVTYLKHLRVLLKYIQQHRGLATSFLSGNTQLNEDIQNLGDLVTAEMLNLQAIEGWINTNARWDNIADHWQRIRSTCKNLTPEANLKQHNTLIANLLYLIDDLAYTHHLNKIGLIDATDTNWRNLLSITEYIGQARALGMGIVSKGNCTNLLRIQLNHLVVKIETTINPVWPESTKQDFRHFLSVIENQVITNPASISAADYFQLASHCIEHVLTEFDRQVDKIQFHRA